MNILLINANPVVSRLLALCTRDRELVLHEVTEVEGIKPIDYEIVFVDDGSYVDAIEKRLETLGRSKKVLISYLKENMEGFDEIIQKPFLPSQITRLIESTISENSVEEGSFIFPLAQENDQEERGTMVTPFPVDKSKEDAISEVEVIEEKRFDLLDEALPEVLDSTEIEKIKQLLEMDEEASEPIEHLTEDEVHLRKVEVIKEQLISEGLEILDEDEIVDALSGKTKEKALKCKKNKVKYQKEQKRQQKILQCSKKELAQIEEAMLQALSRLKPKKMKKFLKGKTVTLKLKLEDSE